MDSLSVYFNAIWQEAQRPLPKTERPSTRADIAALIDALRRTTRRVCTAVAQKWLQPK